MAFLNASDYPDLGDIAPFNEFESHQAQPTYGLAELETDFDAGPCSASREQELARQLRAL